jgi:hypothetical protein
MKAHFERELPAPFREYTMWRARGGGGVEGVPHDERLSVACYDDLEDVG